MQPIGSVFSRFPRVARDLSSKLGKQCDIVMDGKEVEVDKTILEAIGDPLTHRVRNSIDHGVEKPEVRTATGKKAKGTVTLRAYHQAGKVRIDVADDGAGITASKLRQKQWRRASSPPSRPAGWATARRYGLIFHPGFSTAEKITDVSGRGVGMDVATNIEKLGGTVDVERCAHQGDHDPDHAAAHVGHYSLAHCGCRGRVLRRAAECPGTGPGPGGRGERAITKVKDAEVVRLRGELLPIVRIDEVLKLPRQDSTTSGLGR